MANIKTIKSIEEFNQCLSDNKKVAIKFSASWCGPCHIMTSAIKSIDEKDLNGFSFYEVDVDDDFATPLCSRFQVRNIPLTLFYKDGNLINKTVGMQTATKIIELLSKI